MRSTALYESIRDLRLRVNKRVRAHKATNIRNKIKAAVSTNKKPIRRPSRPSKNTNMNRKKNPFKNNNLKLPLQNKKPIIPKKNNMRLPGNGTIKSTTMQQTVAGIGSAAVVAGAGGIALGTDVVKGVTDSVQEVSDNLINIVKPDDEGSMSGLTRSHSSDGLVPGGDMMGIYILLALIGFGFFTYMMYLQQMANAPTPRPTNRPSPFLQGAVGITPQPTRNPTSAPTPAPTELPTPYPTF